MRPISDEDKKAALVREIRRRESTYPGLVKAGRMHVSAANHDIMVMREIAADYGITIRERPPIDEPLRGQMLLPLPLPSLVD